MKFYKIKSYAKINISLGVLGKLKSRLHKIESLISFLNLYDEILIKKIKSKKHQVKFNGQFSKKITRNNTILNLLKILDDNKKLGNQKYLIKVNKKIPQQSGMGGGSMNAASVLNYLIKNKKIKLTKNEIFKFASKIGSDVIIGMRKKNSIIYRNGDIKILNKSINLFTVLLKPNFGCSTKEIYNNVRSYSKSVLLKNHAVNLNHKFLSILKNDLEVPAFDKYSTLKKIKIFMEKLDNILFARMTGSGSTIVGYFNSKKAAINAEKLLKKNYKNCWCILSKTI
tara:strand:- start:18 stop:866 length:849 start_codon:yes stop_codon:yes gene_type:complete